MRRDHGRPTKADSKTRAQVVASPGMILIAPYEETGVEELRMAWRERGVNECNILALILSEACVTDMILHLQ